MNRLSSIDLWIGLTCVLCAIGVSLVVIGMFTNISVLRTIGLVLVAPVVIVGIILVVIVIPILIVADRRHNKRPPEK